jgi:predicted dehydrogenase
LVVCFPCDEAASPFHYEICKAAIKAGLHVLVEKPFTLKMAEARELVELAKENKVHIMANQNYRYFSTVLTLKEAICGKALGNPLYANAQFYMYFEGRQYQYEMDDFMLFEMSIHHIDTMRFLFDSNIQTVSAKTWNFANGKYLGDPNVHALYEMESGITVMYLGSLVSKGLSTQWEGSWRIQCEEGSIHLDDLGEGYGVYLVDAEMNKVKMEFVTPAMESIHGSLGEFAASIRESREPATSGKDNIHTLAALVATSLSSREGIHKSLGSV